MHDLRAVREVARPVGGHTQWSTRPEHSDGLGSQFGVVELLVRARLPPSGTVTSAETEAQRRDLVGTPTVLGNGIDAFASPGQHRPSGTGAIKTPTASAEIRIYAAYDQRSRRPPFHEIACEDAGFMMVEVADPAGAPPHRSARVSRIQIVLHDSNVVGVAV